jgi:outer membrane protein OmpA-like peptidoglycan-associated protein
VLRTSPTAKLTRDALFLAPGVALALLASPMSARALGFSVKLEPGVAIPLTAPQSQLYGVGGGGSLKVLFPLSSYLDIGPSASLLRLPSSAGQADAGVAWGFGAGLRLKRPHDAESFHGISPWLDADALYVRTGALNRPGFDAAVGLSVPIGESRNFWVGPFARYFQVIQHERAGFDNRDAKTLILGVSFEVGSGIKRQPEPEALVPAQPPAVEAPARPPAVDKEVVKPAKLELKQKLYFASGRAKLDKASLPVLDEVVQALKDNKDSRVQVEGYADSSGVDAHNQTLSEKRAKAVVDYLVAHGVAKDRLVSKGLGSSVPIDSNTTVAGRKKNRRVEFIILNDGSAS